MRKTQLVLVIAVLSVWGGVAMLSSSCNREEKKPLASAAKTPEESLAKPSAPASTPPGEERSEGIPPVAAGIDNLMEAMVTIDGEPYSEETVRTFILTYGAGPHGTKGIEKTVDDFIDRELAVRDMIRRGLDRRKDVARQVRIFRLSSLGVDYMLHGLDAKIPVGADEVKSALPKKFRVGIFDLLRFDTEEEAREALKSIRNETEFAHYAKEHPERLKDTGEIFPMTGFFHPFDDAGLFNRKSGELAGYLETGIGPAIVSVREVRDLAPAEIESVVERERKAIRDRKRPDLVRTLVGKHRVRYERDRVYDLAGKELREGIGPVHDTVVASVDGLEISYRNLRAWINRDYIGSLGAISEEELGRFMYNDLENLVRQVTLGMEAEAEGFRLTDPNYRKALEELTRRYYALVAITDRAGGEIRVSEEEVRREFDEHRDTKYTEAERVQAGHIFCRLLKKAQDVERKLKEGKPFEEAAREYSDDRNAKENGGRLGYVLNTPAIHPNIRKALFGRAWKDNTVTGIVHSDAGYHLFKIYRHYPERKIPYSEAKDGIRKMLKFRKFEETRRKYAAELRSRFRVVRNETKIAKMMKQLEERKRHNAPPSLHH
ncbi:MAG: hypothetical protein Kow00128_16240 [Deltaproteobacteria bacterium]